MNRWSKNEVNFLIKNFSNMSDIEISKHLNKSVKSIQSKSRKLNLLKSKEYIKNINKIRVEDRWSDKLWSKDDLDFLANNINNMSNSELAKSLNRSKNSIVSMCINLNIKRNCKYTDEYIESECSKYIAKSELKINNPNLIAWLYKKGKLKEICDKYTDYSIFIKHQKSTYNKLYYLGILKDFTKHMEVKNINNLCV